MADIHTLPVLWFSFVVLCSVMCSCRRSNAVGAQQTPIGSGMASPLPPSSPYTAATSPAPPAPPSSSSSSNALAAAAAGSSGGGAGMGGSHGSNPYLGLHAAPQSAASSEMGDWEGAEPRSAAFGEQGLNAPHDLHPSGLGLSGRGFGGQGSVASESWGMQDPQLPPINTSTQPAAAAAAAAGSSGGSNGETAAMRLGLKLEQRSDVRRLVDVLARRVRQAGDDLAAVVAEVGVLAGAQLFWRCRRNLSSRQHVVNTRAEHGDKHICSSWMSSNSDGQVHAGQRLCLQFLSPCVCQHERCMPCVVVCCRFTPCRQAMLPCVSP